MRFSDLLYLHVWDMLCIDECQAIQVIQPRAGAEIGAMTSLGLVLGAKHVVSYSA